MGFVLAGQRQQLATHAIDTASLRAQFAPDSVTSTAPFDAAYNIQNAPTVADDVVADDGAVLGLSYPHGLRCQYH